MPSSFGAPWSFASRSWRRSFDFVALVILLGSSPAEGQTTSERRFITSSSASGSVNDCTLRVRSNESSASEARIFRVRPRSHQLTVWVDPGFTIPATFIDCLGNTVNVPAGMTVSQYVDLLLDIATCRLQANQGLAGDVSCCVEVRRIGGLVAINTSPLATPSVIASKAECRKVHRIDADLKFVNSIPAGTCQASALCGQNKRNSLLVVGAGNCASATIAHELGHNQGLVHSCSSDDTCSDGTACPCTASAGQGGTGSGSCAAAANGGCPAAGTCTNEIMWWAACGAVNKVVINANECDDLQDGIDP